MEKAKNFMKLFRTIGITGGIASGKSTMVKCLKILGAKVIDADKVGHSCYLPGSNTL